MTGELDIVIPVYNEAENILPTLRALARELKPPARVLICYDRDDDNTLPTVRNNPDAHAGLPVIFVRNQGRGAHAAVMAGFAASTAPDSDAAAVDLAFQAAQQAFKGYKRTTPGERQALLLQLADLIETNADRLLVAEVACTGKHRAVTRELEILRGAAGLDAPPACGERAGRETRAVGVGVGRVGAAHEGAVGLLGGRQPGHGPADRRVHGRRPG